jgi:O-antigen ligase
MLVGCLFLGGGTHSGFLADAILQLVSLPLICLAIIELRAAPTISHLKWPLVFVALVCALPVVQLLPLPASIWVLLPGRDVIGATYALLGGALPARPLTLSPASTCLSFLSLLPPSAIFLGTLILENRQRRLLSILVIVVGVASAVLGLLQLAGGPNSGLRFYAITNHTDAVGFFANRNHFAALLYTSMLLALCWMVETSINIVRSSGRRRFASDVFMPFACASVAFFVLLAAQLTARSRAGLLLAIAALIAGLALSGMDRRAASLGTRSVRIMIGMTAATIVFSLPFGLYRILDRFDHEMLIDGRVAILRNAISAAWAYMPFGSGLGTFVSVYQMFEKPSDIGVAFVNHAHNDLLEVWLETGVTGLILLTIYAAWLVRRVIAVWQRSCGFGETREIDVGLARACSIVLLLLLAHSLVDYPLRTYAMAGVGAFASAVLVRRMGSANDDESLKR